MVVVHHTAEPGTRAGRFSFGPSDDDDVEDQRVRSLGSPDPSKPVAEGTVYSSLTRNANLPPLKTTSMDKDVKHIYDKMAAGSFLGRYKYDDELRTRGFKTPSFVVFAGVSKKNGGGDDSVPSSLRGNLIRVEVHSDIVVQGGYVNRAVKTAHDTTIYSKKFSGILRPEEKLLLSFRILHQVLRFMATEFPSDVVEVLCESLIHHYMSTRNYRACLDVSLIKADCALHTSQSDEKIGHAMVQVGEYLEAVKEIEKGARVYAQVIDTYFVAASADKRARVCHHAGLAFRNAGCLDEAEDYLLLGWSYLCQGRGEPDLNGDEATDLFTSMLILYEERQKSMAEASPKGDNEVVIEPLPILLISLLYTAGFRASNFGHSHDMIFVHGPNLSRIFLKPSLRGNKRGSLRALIEAGSQPGREYFVQSLLNAKDPQVKEAKLSIQPETVNSCAGPDAKATAKTIRTMLKKNATGSSTTYYSCVSCGASEAPSGSKYMQCPCHAAIYCSKDCQVAHWKEHKKYCAVKNKK